MKSLSTLANRVSLGELDAPEFAIHGRDEIKTLAQSFARMRHSLGLAWPSLAWPGLAWPSEC